MILVLTVIDLASRHHLLLVMLDFIVNWELQHQTLMAKCGDITVQQVVKIFLSIGVIVENNQMFPMRHCAQNGRRQILIIEFCHKPPSFLYDFQLL